MKGSYSGLGMGRVSSLVTIRAVLLLVGCITILLAAGTEVFAQGALDLWKQAQELQKEGNRVMSSG